MLAVANAKAEEKAEAARARAAQLADDRMWAAALEGRRPLRGI
jgi:putative SOS response-associated peptidase YedK